MRTSSSEVRSRGVDTIAVPIPVVRGTHKLGQGSILSNPTATGYDEKAVQNRPKQIAGTRHKTGKRELIVYKSVKRAFTGRITQSCSLSSGRNNAAPKKLVMQKTSTNTAERSGNSKSTLQGPDDASPEVPSEISSWPSGNVLPKLSRAAFWRIYEPDPCSWREAARLCATRHLRSQASLGHVT